MRVLRHTHLDEAAHGRLIFLLDARDEWRLARRLGQHAAARVCRDFVALALRQERTVRRRVVDRLLRDLRDPV